MADVKQILDTVNNALTVIKQVANTPGVNMIPYASTVSGAISALQAAYTAERDVEPYIVAISNTFSGVVPTPEQLSELDAKIAHLDAQVDAPLLPAEPDEPA